jgi:hypothetical protein
MARPKKLPVSNIELKEPKPRKVDFKAMAQKLQDALAKEMIENQTMAENNAKLHAIIARQEVIIQYLESKLR